MRQCNTYCFTLSHALTDYSFFDIGSNKSYLKSTSVAFSKTYIGKFLAENNTAKVSCYFAGDYLSHLSLQEIETIGEHVSNGQIELLAGTYHYSLSCLFSQAFFQEEIESHFKLIEKLFGVKPLGFYNTLAVFSNDLIPTLRKYKLLYCFAPALGWYLNGIDEVAANSVDSKLKLLVLSSTTDPKCIVRHFQGESDEPIQLKTIQAKALFKKGKEKHTYVLPNVVGIDANNRDLDFYLGNSLQAQVFETLKSIAQNIKRSGDKKLNQELLPLSTPQLFALLHEDAPNRLHHYGSMMAILADQELEAG